jgi:large-conductance mechanosensitive channel
MFFAFLAAILAFSVIIFVVWRLVKERSAETERAEEEERKATPDPNEFH